MARHVDGAKLILDQRLVDEQSSGVIARMHSRPSVVLGSEKLTS
jgi:hypothetical protein